MEKPHLISERHRVVKTKMLSWSRRFSCKKFPKRPRERRRKRSRKTRAGLLNNSLEAYLCLEELRENLDVIIEYTNSRYLSEPPACLHGRRVTCCSILHPIPACHFSFFTNMKWKISPSVCARFCDFFQSHTQSLVGSGNSLF